MDDQFDKLLLGPLTSLSEDPGPIIIIIDNLDQCGRTIDAQKDLLNILSEEWKDLPHFLRFLIVSHSEDDIDLAFHGKSHIVERKLTAEKCDVSSTYVIT